MTEAAFDIFRGCSKQDALWLEVVDGLSNARERMQSIADETPGCYFIYSTQEHSIVVTVETFGNS